MHWYFRDISNDPSEKELTQQDQFNNDEVVLAEALVRETIQNSTDARATRDSAVHVRFSIQNRSTRPHVETLGRIVGGLTPHLARCNFPVPNAAEPIRVLTIEDFGTTGLTGSVQDKDNEQFSGFWRRFGRSNKQGSKGGRWGLGKLVFPSASSSRTVIGITRRNHEDCAWLMGQAILRNHTIVDGQELDSVGFWCREDGRPGSPTSDAAICSSVSEAAGLIRRSEPGLSLVIPYVLSDITSEHLIAAAVKNYYFPILTGRLVVTIDDTVINSETYDSVYASLPGGVVSASVLNFVRHLHERREPPQFVVPVAWQRKGLTGDLLGVETATQLKDLFKSGGMLTLRAPLVLKQKDGTDCESHIDLFLRASSPGERTDTLIVRGDITVPTEGKKIAFPDCNAALLATSEPISRLLGDAENPAHTQWNERAEKLRAGWLGGNSVLRRVRRLLPDIYALVSERIEREDPFALIDFFSVPKSDSGGSARRPTVGRPGELPQGSPKAFRIVRRSGGFAVLPGPGMQSDVLPLKMRVRCAYDVLSGNPFKRFSPFDFSFYEQTVSVTKEGAYCIPVEPNEFEIEAKDSDFKVEITGFDTNRDLIIEAEG